MEKHPAASRPVVVLLFLQLMAGSVVAPCFALLPVYLSRLGLAAVAISWVFVLQRIAGLVASLAGGTLIDRLGSRTTLLVGLAAFVAGPYLFLTGAPVAVSVLWAVSGLGLGLLSLGGQAYLIEAASPRYLGVLTALYYWGHTLGATLSNTASGAALGRIGYRGLGFALGAIGAFTLLACLLALPVTGRGKQPGRRDKLFGYATVARRRPAQLLAGLRFLPTFCYGMLTVFVPLALRNAGATEATVAYYAAASSLSASGAQLLAGRIADRRSLMAPAFTAHALMVLAPALMALFASSLTAVFILGVVALSAAWSLSALLPSFVSRVTESTDRGRVLGFIHLFWNIGMIGGALAGGVLFERAPILPFLVGGLVNVPAVFLLARVPRWFEPAPESSAPA